MKLQSLALPFLSLLGIGHAYVLSTDCPSDSMSSNSNYPLSGYYTLQRLHHGDEIANSLCIGK